MKAKKLLTAIIASSMILILTGCRENDETSASGSEPHSPLESLVQSAASTNENANAPESAAQPASGLTDSTSEPNSTPYVPPNNNDVGEVSGTILVLDGGRGIPLYGIGYEPGRNYARTVNKYKEQLGANVNVYSMVVPTQVSFYLPEKYSELSDKELPHIEDINEHLSGIIPIDAYSALKVHAGEEIYYRTDHHWTQLGAYYAAEKFAETALAPFDALSEYEKNERGYFSGNLSAMLRNSQVGAKSETFVWYEPKRDVTNTAYDIHVENGVEQSYFKPSATNYGGDHYLVFHNGVMTHTSTGLETGRRLMIVGDSLPWPFAPCLFGSFDDVWLLDFRGCEVSVVELAKDKGITDLLFCSSISVATTDSEKALAKIM